MVARVYTPEEIEKRIKDIEFKPQHTAACQKKNGYARWAKPDRRKTCIGCKLSACGVVFDAFERIATDETDEAAAKDVIRNRYRKINGEVVQVQSVEATPERAVEDYLTDVAEESTASTVATYRTFLDQFVAYCDWRKIQYVRQIDQDFILDFRATLTDAEAEYKKNSFAQDGLRRRWTTLEIPTIRRRSRTLKTFFDRCIARKWMTENPTTILKMHRAKSEKKSKDQVKYLSRQQMEDIMWAVDHSNIENKNRLKAVILTMRWTGLRIGDASTLKKSMIRDGVLFKITTKSKTPVQIPLPKELNELLSKMTPYEGGYLFWDRREVLTSKEATPSGNFGFNIKKMFVSAGIPMEDVKLISHRFRNTFVVHLLSKGVPIETVSLMLGHASISTTADYYAAYSHTYMDRAEKLVRKVWDLGENEKLAV